MLCFWVNRVKRFSEIMVSLKIGKINLNVYIWDILILGISFYYEMEES